MRFTGGRYGRPMTLAAAAAVLALTGTALIAVVPAVAAQAGGTSAGCPEWCRAAPVAWPVRPLPARARRRRRPDRASVGRGGADGRGYGLGGGDVRPGPVAPLSVRVGFQDGGDRALFTRAPGQGWKVAGLGGQTLGCDTRVPAAIRRLWGSPVLACLRSAPRDASAQAAATPRRAAARHAANQQAATAPTRPRRA